MLYFVICCICQSWRILELKILNLQTRVRFPVALPILFQLLTTFPDTVATRRISLAGDTSRCTTDLVSYVSRVEHPSIPEPKLPVIDY
jgi:hypothetical protein